MYEETYSRARTQANLKGRIPQGYNAHYINSRTGFRPLARDTSDFEAP